MCGGSTPDLPAVTPEAPTMPDSTASAASNTDARRQAAAKSTILTSSRGVTSGAATATKTLLGQ